MPVEPTVKPLSYSNRSWVFWILLGVFIVAMPVFVFYAMGYRIDFANDRSIITVGGLYVNSTTDDALMFVDEKPVENMRIFQSAAYIQNLDSGMHRIHVQKAGYQTWVKELPVYSRFVTEASAFNVPEVPQIRYIPVWLNQTGIPVVIHAVGDEPQVFTIASTTNTVVSTTSRSTLAYTENSEYEYAVTLFEDLEEPVTARRALDITAESPTLDPEEATTTKSFRDARLFESKGEVYVEWRGSNRNIPYYYCVQYTTPATTTAEYGEHVFDSLVEEFDVTLDLADPTVRDTRLCRDTIRIDRKEQDVLWFDFLPGSQHHVLMLLEDGLYVVEADDRAWQNVQLLYPGEDLEMRVDGGRIYVFDGESYFEVMTAIPS